MEIILNTLISMGILSIVLAMILYFVAQKFKVIEDPRVDIVCEQLPGANCGGCGFPGCKGFAEEIVARGSLENLFCPAGGNPTMKNVADALGLVAEEKEPQIAVIRCNGTFEFRKKVSEFDGAKTCAISNATYSGESGCPHGCLGFGDCVSVCQFDAIKMDATTGLPVVDEEKCTACNACVVACPKVIIELRNKGKKGRRIFVSCISQEKGGDAMKQCKAACIGCQKCFKECKFEAITMGNNLAYINYNACKLCRKCVTVCPTKAIWEMNFPPPKEKPVAKPAAKPVEKPVEKPVDNANPIAPAATEKPQASTNEQTVAKPIENTTEKTSEIKEEKPAINITEKPIETSAAEVIAQEPKEIPQEKPEIIPIELPEESPAEAPGVAPAESPEIIPQERPANLQAKMPVEKLEREEIVL